MGQSGMVIGRANGAPTEVPVFLPSREAIGAVVTIPADTDASVGVVLMAGRARDRAHRNGMFVTVARELADNGFYVMRIDYPGVGNSTGDPQVFNLERTPSYAIEDACHFLLEHTPVRRVIFVGTCFGSRVLLHAAPALPAVDGIFFGSPPVFSREPTMRKRIRNTIRKIRRRTRKRLRGASESREILGREPPATRGRVSPSFATALMSFLTRGTVYFLSAEDDYASELRVALKRLRPDPARYEVEFRPGDLHNFTSLDVQRLTIDRIVAFCSNVAAREPVSG